jgi:hypothetical protein
MEKQPIFKDINIILTSGGITKEKFEWTNMHDVLHWFHGVCKTSTRMGRDLGKGFNPIKSWSKCIYLGYGNTSQGFNKIKIHGNIIVQTCGGEGHRIGRIISVDG